ncbi:class I SAM-dependent methyltransferase [Endozoicomonas sp. SM1973]|uniref:Class I SAM-dependent methyltransferase n=1 Tax=Spartinivicinus marinus TaxID=2994442 RepID=A0A853IC87_9GAMM|nr:class I SAM-dependent methyltransferase [Spartinivicinus marinus]MCX4028607.1 class I SAM-dependent methyltransferase [Spartinivicinus marinus]NYZ67127.1 class I SAM-dependent methyltransferase [Spartinivicinus marinus]
MHKKISDEYRSKGIAGFYKNEGELYRNPHEPLLESLLKQSLDRKPMGQGCVLDLACGSGEITIILEKHGFTNIDAIDPYTYKAYKRRTGRDAEKFSFEDIAEGCIANKQYELVICSFAMHLVNESWLPRVCFNLSLIANHLIILTPHKRPKIQMDWGWVLDFELLENRVRARSYRSLYRQEVAMQGLLR